ncbi:MAG: alanine racemase [Verrucomicrobiota bacterium]
MSQSSHEFRCWAEVDLKALRANARVCQELAGPDCGILGVVKADAYGHGLRTIAAALAEEINGFGVANVREADEVADTVTDPGLILILSPALPFEIEAIIRRGYSASVSNQEEVALFDKTAKSLNRVAKLHAVADTGMGRMGAKPEDFRSLVDAIQQSSHCELEGLDTHFPSADEEPEFTREQITHFYSLLSDLTTNSQKPLIHLSNSAGLLNFQSLTPAATLSRPGLALYGISPMSESSDRLRPVLTWKSRVTLVREIGPGTTISYGRTFQAERTMRVATLAFGYGDGYPRHVSGGGAEVLIRGQRCQLLGRVTMDQVVVDVSHLDASISPGEEVVMMGQQGEANISAHELARLADTIPWHILTSITPRVTRLTLG